VFLKFIKIIKVFSNTRLCRMLLSMNYNEYLKEIGWIESFKMKMPAYKDLKPIHWITYALNKLEILLENPENPDIHRFNKGVKNA